MMIRVFTVKTKCIQLQNKYKVECKFEFIEIKSNVAPLDSVGCGFYSNHCIHSVHNCVLLLVCILGRCYETEKKLL